MSPGSAKADAGRPSRGPRSWQGSRPVRRRRASAFIRYFDATPAGIICPHFFTLAHANGCPFRCGYCYLQLTFRRNPAPVIYTNLDDLQAEVRRFLRRPQPAVLNAGELADALAFDRQTKLTEALVPMFAEQRTHKLLLLTKSTTVGNLLRLEHNGQTIVSFSLNATPIAEQFELGAPSPPERLEAARAVQEAGYPLRLRVDPMIPLEGWPEEYGRLADLICRSLRPDRITLGTIRYFASLPRFSSNGQRAYSYATSKEGADGRLRVPLDERAAMYKALASRFPDIPVALCKETEEAWTLSGLDPERCLCNCAL